MSRPTVDLHPAATGLTLFRIEKDEPVAFSAASGARPAIVRLLRACAALGYLTDTKADDCYGLLDVLDDEDSIVQDFGLTRDGWRYAYRKVGVLRREPEPDTGEEGGR